MSVYTHQGEDYTINDPNVADEFSSSKAYAVGEYAYYQGNLVKFISTHAAGAWNADHVEQVKLAEEFTAGNSNVEYLLNSVNPLRFINFGGLHFFALDIAQLQLQLGLLFVQVRNLILDFPHGFAPDGNPAHKGYCDHAVVFHNLGGKLF